MGVMGRAHARSLAIVLILSATAAAVSAQPVFRVPPIAPVSVALTIDEAVTEALDHNLTLVAERYALAVADARILTAQLRPNPVLTSNVMLPDHTTFTNNISPREQVLRTDVVIERGGKRDRRIEVARSARSVAELQFLNTMRTVVLDVENAFVDVVLAKQNAALARQSLEAFNALVQVNTLLSRNRTGPIDAAGDLRRDPQPVNIEAVRERAIALRPDLLAMRRDQARSAADLRLQIAQGRIDYTISGELHRQHQPGPPNATGFLYGVYASVPLPIFNRNQGEIVRANEEALQLEARVRALEADVNHEVDAAYEAYRASREVVGTIEARMLSQARDVRSTTEYSYRRGEASFVEFLDAVRVFNETMQSYNA